MDVWRTDEVADHEHNSFWTYLLINYIRPFIGLINDLQGIISSGCTMFLLFGFLILGNLILSFIVLNSLIFCMIREAEGFSKHVVFLYFPFLFFYFGVSREREGRSFWVFFLSACLSFFLFGWAGGRAGRQPSLVLFATLVFALSWPTLRFIEDLLQPCAVIILTNCDVILRFLILYWNVNYIS